MGLGDSLKDLIAKLIVDANLSFEFVEKETFRALIHFLNPKVKSNIPKADSIEAHVMTMFSETKTKLKDDINDVKKVSLTCDLWTPPNCKSILGVTGHWITNDWILKDVLLDAVEIKGNHSGNNIAKHIVKICDTYGITDKIFCITADNATSNKTMASSFSNLIPHFRMSQHLLGCASLVFNLAAKAGISAVEKSTEEYLTEIGLDSDERMSEMEVNED